MEFADAPHRAHVKGERLELFVIQYLESVAAPKLLHHVLHQPKEIYVTQIIITAHAQQLVQLAMKLNSALLNLALVILWF